MWTRVWASAAVIVVAMALKAFWFPVSMIGSARVAGGQLANSDQAAVVSVVGMSFFSGATMAHTLIVFVALAFIWWPVLRNGITKLVEEDWD